jgi:phage-related protein
MLPVDIMRTKQDILACYLLAPLVKYSMSIHTNCNLYPNQYNQTMKPVRFLGDSLKCLREFPEDAKQDAGYQLDKVQKGKQPDDFKPMSSIGMGVEEIRIRDDSGIYRVIYTVRIADAVYVLHAFQKKTQATARRDIEIAKERLAQLMRGRK